MTRHRLILAAVLAVVLAACTGAGSSGSSAPTTDDTTSGPDTGGGGYEVCWTASASGGSGPIELVDDTSGFGLIDPLIGLRGHAAAWGDIDGDGDTDLVVGTFATARNDVYLERGATGPAPDRVLIQNDGSFAIDGTFPEQFGRTSGIALVDLDGDGDLDLLLSRNANERQQGATTAIFENTSDGFAEVPSGIDPDLGGRSVGLLDYNHDDRLDLVIVEDRYTGGSTRIYRNLGGLGFVDVSEEIGFPLDVHGLGVATGDLNSDGYTDIFIAGSNRLFAGTPDGFAEVADAIGGWEVYGPEDDVSGAAIADVNRDGRLDLLVGHHFNSTLSQGNQVPVRLYLNETADGSTISFRDVTAESGLAGIPTKAPHVEFADIDNDGWPDVVTSASAKDGTQPAVFRHLGLSDGIPRFEVPDGLGSAQYWVTSPTGDVNRDGLLDLFAVEWEPSLPSILFVNETAGGHWIEVSVVDIVGGVGARVEIYEAGRSGEPGALLGAREITATVGYTAGVELTSHFGLGDVSEVDIVVIPTGGNDPTALARVAVDRRISVGGGC